MSENQSDDPAPTGTKSTYRQLLIWPAALLLIALWGLRTIPSMFAEMSVPVITAQFMGPAAIAGLIVLWWLFLSRATIQEKLLGLVGLAVIGAVTTYLADPTIRGFGMIIYAIPWGFTAFTVALICTSRMQSPKRTGLALLAALVGFGYWDLIRTDEIRGDFQTVQNWRWVPTAEEQFLEELESGSRQQGTAAPDEAALALADPEWPSFRGPNRDGVMPGIVLAEDWDAAPPRELWRVRVGPGWSSFSVAGDLLFTQEQRGDNEAVVCFDAKTGAQIWVHEDKSRFWESVGGAGPRATPTISEGRLFSFGAMGVLNRLDPVTGAEVWHKEISTDAEREPPMWGFASSPLVVDDVVIVHAGGPGNKGVLAYDVDTGDLRWTSPAGDHSYSSPQLTTIQGQQCVLMLSNSGINFIDPADGTLLGEHKWPYENYRVVQPRILDEYSMLLGSGLGAGTQRLKVTWDGSAFKTETTWESQRISPYFNDFVSHNGYLYGFDNNVFACVDLATGERKWKRGRYGNGQVVLVPDGDQLLLTSEDGELVLLRATPDKLVELTTYRVLDGRTWNHPVLVGNRLFVRNGEEAAAFEMPTVETEDALAEAVIDLQDD